jgi:hypothetical protein
MAESFDVKNITVPVLGTPGANIAYPLFHVPSAGGAITITEAFFSCATAESHGTMNLLYGTLNAAGGTLGTIGTIGTAAGTCGARGIVAMILKSPCVVPANSWVGISAQTTWGLVDNQSTVHICYVTGR